MIAAHFVVTIDLMTNEQAPAIPFIPERRRQLYFQIIQDFALIQTIALRMYFLDDHFPPQHLDRALNWLITHRFIGKEFVLWFEHVCKKSDLEMHRILLAEIQKEKSGNLHLVAGKNFKL